MNRIAVTQALVLAITLLVSGCASGTSATSLRPTTASNDARTARGPTTSGNDATPAYLATGLGRPRLDALSPEPHESRMDGRPAERAPRSR